MHPCLFTHTGMNVACMRVMEYYVAVRKNDALMCCNMNPERTMVRKKTQTPDTEEQHCLILSCEMPRQGCQQLGQGGGQFLLNIFIVFQFGVLKKF